MKQGREGDVVNLSALGISAMDVSTKILKLL